MATRTSLDTKVSPPPSPRSPELPNIGSLAVTGVISGEVLQGTQRSSDDAMQTLQRQQTQPTIVPTLSPSRANTWVADDLDALLDETLEEFNMSLEPSSSSSVQPAAAPSIAPAAIELSFHEIEELLVSIICFQYAEALVPANLQKSFDEDIGQFFNRCIRPINLFFKSLLAQSANPGPWLESEGTTSFFGNIHPFGASCFLMEHLDKAKPIHPYLNQALLTEWKDNYQQCVLLLKRNRLDRYNETEFPISEKFKPTISMAQMADEQCQDPQTAELVREQMSSFAKDPEGMIDKLQPQNPELAEMMRAQMKALRSDPQGMLNQMQAQNSQLAEMMRAQMGTSGTNPAVLVKLIEPQIQLLLAFFNDLDRVLQKHAKNAGDVEAWLKAEVAKSTYQHPFFLSMDISDRLASTELSSTEIPPSIIEMKKLSGSCCERLKALGLQRYIEEAPPRKMMDSLRQAAMSQKGGFQDILSRSLSFLRPLSEELKKLNLVPAARDANRQTIEGWITSCKSAGTYFPPFIVSRGLCLYMPAFEGILDEKQLRELNVLYPFCREQLLALGLKTHLTEMPSPIQLDATAAPAASAPNKAMSDSEQLAKEMTFLEEMIKKNDITAEQCLKDNGMPELDLAQTAKPAAASAPKKAMSDSERFKNELAFFRTMFKQDDKTVEQWLKDNSPKSDYPLLWAKKRMSQLSHFRDTVNMDLRREWRVCAETCLENIEGPALRHHMDIANIPADASAELRAFLA